MSAKLRRYLLKLPLAVLTAMPTLPTVAGDLGLEEVVVTAQKRTESLQDVPISVATYNTEALDLRVIDDLKDIGTSIPNLYINPFNTDPTAIRLFIRGIGQNDVQITQDPSVALYADGVYIGTSFGSGLEGVDIERLEVLRGPQGTLYGRNATGGAVNIITRRANTEQFEFRQDLVMGNLDKVQSKTLLNLPLGERFAAKLNYVKSERGGYVENNSAGKDFGEEDRRSAVLDLRWQAADDLTLDYRYEDAQLQDSQRMGQVLQVVDAPLSAFTTFNDDVSMDFLDEATPFRRIVSNDQKIKAHSLWVTWEPNDSISLRSITAYRDLDSWTAADSLATAEGDYTILGFGVGAINVNIADTQFEQSSQEFQLLGNTEHWTYAAGIYYYTDEATQDASDTTTLGVSGRADLTETDNESYAVYAQATWNPDFMEQRWSVTLGGRYSYDERRAERINDNATVPFSGSYDNDFDNFNPSLTIAYDVNDTVNVYGKVVSGYKSGGTSMRSANAQLFADGFEEEDILSYELGLKGDFWDQRARLNGALFYMELDGKQTSVQTDPVSPAGRDFLPIDGNEVSGAELDLSLLLTEGLTFNASYGYLDTQLGESSVDSSAGTFELIDNFALAPENSYSLALNYRRGLPNGELMLNVDYGWQDEVNSSVNAGDNTVVDSYGLLGATLGWSDIRVGQLPGSLRVLCWGRNLTDEEYGLVSSAAWSIFGAPELQTYGDPRTWGVTLSYQY